MKDHKTFTLTNPKPDFGIQHVSGSDINPQIGDTGIILKSTQLGVFVRFTKFPGRDYFLYHEEISNVEG